MVPKRNLVKLLQAVEAIRETPPEPPHYWTDLKSGPVEIASLTWRTERIYRLMARPRGKYNDYYWLVSGAGARVPDNPKSTPKPFTAAEVTAVIEKSCFQAGPMRRAWRRGGRWSRRASISTPQTRTYSRSLCTTSPTPMPSRPDSTRHWRTILRRLSNSGERIRWRSGQKNSNEGRRAGATTTGCLMTNF